jgi:hypothetical protein
MRDGSLNRRFIEIMLGLILIVVGLSAVFGDQMLTLVLGLIGFYLLARQFDRTNVQTTQREREPVEVVSSHEVAERSDQPYSHAIQAARRAGLDPADAPVLPVDIGVMAFTSDQEPVIYRTVPVMDNVDYIQPFVQLRLQQRAVGRIRFEIVDSDGQVLFIHEDRHQLQPGLNLITPSSRLPIHDAHAMQAEWQLRVSADGVPIAAYSFGWEESASKVIRRHLSEDGEISNEIRTMMAENRLEEMSLDELLSSTQDETAERRQTSRKG